MNVFPTDHFRAAFLSNRLQTPVDWFLDFEVRRRIVQFGSSFVRIPDRDTYLFFLSELNQGTPEVKFQEETRRKKNLFRFTDKMFLMEFLLKRTKRIKEIVLFASGDFYK